MAPMRDPMSFCAQGWHRWRTSDEPPMWVRYNGRLRGEHPVLVFQFGPRPELDACRRVWDYDRIFDPLICDACGRPIDAEPPPPLPRRVTLS